MNSEENVSYYCKEVSNYLRRFIHGAKNIGLKNDEMSVAKIIEMYNNRPLQTDPGKDLQKIKINVGYKMLESSINSSYLNKYLQQKETIEIIDEIFRYRIDEKPHGIFIFNHPERYFLAKCLSLGIKQLREKRGWTYKRIALAMGRSVNFVRSLENCNAGKENYKRLSLTSFLPTLLDNSSCTVQYIFFSSNEYDQTEDGCIYPMNIISDKRHFEAAELKKLTEASDITAMLIKILKSKHNKRYLEFIRRMLKHYCDVIDSENNSE